MRYDSSLIALLLVASAAFPTGAQVQSLGWMSGCWQQRTPNRGTVVEEQWMAPKAASMIGMGRTVRGDTALVEYEHLRISQRGSHAIYHAEPSGQPPADFEAKNVTDSLVVFENPTHDFPQRVIYRKRGADSLLARIEGTMGGKFRGIDFPYARVKCP